MYDHTKPCAKCVHYCWAGGELQPQCGAPGNLAPPRGLGDVVYGTAYRYRANCFGQRRPRLFGGDNHCGPEGKWFAAPPAP